MEGLDRGFLQQELVDRPVGTFPFSGGGLQATDTAPDDAFAAVVVPVDAPVRMPSCSSLQEHLLEPQSQKKQRDFGDERLSPVGQAVYR